MCFSQILVDFDFLLPTDLADLHLLLLELGEWEIRGLVLNT